MCDELTEADNARPSSGGELDRRRFGMGMSAAAIAALLPSPAAALPVRGRRAVIATPDGRCDAYFVAPTTGKHPGVLIWPDIMGLRPAFEAMARRLAESGYAVLAVNQFYRSTKAPFLKPGETMSTPGTSDRIGGWRKLLTPQATVSDARTFVDWLDRQAAVDSGRGLGVTGYCMGGPMMMRTAAARDDRVRAGASFHGAGLVGDAADSPDKLIARLKGRYLFAIAANDDARSPTDKDVLRRDFAAAHVPAEIEVYAGTMHGWCPPDSRVYDRTAAERAWARQLALLKTL